MSAHDPANVPDRDLVAALVARPEQFPKLRMVQTRRKRGTVRSVYIYEDRLVIKQYAAFPWDRWWRAYWRREHAALERLRGLPVPETYGFFAARNGSLRSMLYVRECVAGEALIGRCDPVAPEYVPEIARLTAQVHRRRVIANDYSLHNIRIAPDNRIVFIDFHRAHVFPRANARYWFYLGKDLGHIYRVSCRRRAELFKSFLAEYFNAMGDLTHGQRRLMLAGCRFWCWLKLDPGPRLPG